MTERKHSSADFDRIDDIVRRAYEGFLNEELPERFTVLLEKLKKGELPQNAAPPEEQA